MTGPTFTVELTDEQARILSEIAQAHGMDPAAVLVEAVGHGLAMIAAGVDDSDLIEPWDRPAANNPPPMPPHRPEDEGDDLPF